MLRSLFTGVLMARLAAVAVGLSSPARRAALEAGLDAAFKGVVTAVAGGVLAALAIATLIATGAYGLLQAGHINSLQALAITASIMAVGVIVLLLYGRAKLQGSVRMFGELPGNAAGARFTDALQDIADGFMEGLTTDRQPAPVPPTPSRTSPQIVKGGKAA